MKVRSFLVMCMFLSSFSSFAGGQIGSGGNGCWVHDEGTLVWRSIEQLAHPEIIEKQSRKNKISLPGINSNGFIKFNAYDKTGLKKTFSRFDKLKRFSPHTYQALKNISSLFKTSYVVKKAPQGIFDGFLLLPYDCVSFEPALMTLNNGTIVFFEETWRSLDGLTSEIILIHETLRLAQMFHPAFKSMDHSELQIIAALFFADGNFNYHLKSRVLPFERKIKEVCSEIGTNYVGNDFENKFLQGTCLGGNQLEKFNIWRSVDLRNRLKIERDLSDLFR